MRNFKFATEFRPWLMSRIIDKTLSNMAGLLTEDEIYNTGHFLQYGDGNPFGTWSIIDWCWVILCRSGLEEVITK